MGSSVDTGVGQPAVLDDGVLDEGVWLGADVLEVLGACDVLDGVSVEVALGDSLGVASRVSVTVDVPGVLGVVGVLGMAGVLTLGVLGASGFEGESDRDVA